MADKLADLHAKRAGLIDDLNDIASGEKFDKEVYDAKEKDLTALDDQIERAKKAQALAASLARPVEAAAVGADADPSKFKSLGEQLLTIARHTPGGAADPRLIRAPIGAGETDSNSGGFLVQTDFATAILQRVYEMGQISSKVFRLPISGNANGIKMNGVDETSRANGSRWGGVNAFWIGEGDAAAASKPKFRVIELDLKKLACIYYATDELLADASAFSAIANRAFSEEILFKTEDAFVRGGGAGIPLGFLNSPAKITVAAEKGQGAGTIVKENIDKMWARMWGRSRLNAVWFYNQEIEPQLQSLNMAVGTGGVPVYLPPGGLTAAPYATLYGRPMVPVEYAEALGTEGDLFFADFSQYIAADKGGVNAASSIHVRFLTDEMTFRFIYRVDGQPSWHAPLTPYKGTNTLAPFVTLASR